MLLRLFQLLSTVLGLALATSADAELIRTAVPRASLNYLSIYAAEAKGFFKDEGLENETIASAAPRRSPRCSAATSISVAPGAADCAPPRKERS
jgi:ABC-type nitrate/sulfonate/bicarbonate transport system substrate-binding protein